MGHTESMRLQEGSRKAWAARGRSFHFVYTWNSRDYVIRVTISVCLRPVTFELSTLRASGGVKQKDVCSDPKLGNEAWVRNRAVYLFHMWTVCAHARSRGHRRGLSTESWTLCGGEEERGSAWGLRITSEVTGNPRTCSPLKPREGSTVRGMENSAVLKAPVGLK